MRTEARANNDSMIFSQIYFEKLQLGKKVTLLGRFFFNSIFLESTKSISQSKVLNHSAQALPDIPAPTTEFLDIFVLK